MGSVGPWELVLILAIAILLFGPSRLAGFGKAAGKTMREFREALSGGGPRDSSDDHGSGGPVSPPQTGRQRKDPRGLRQ